MILTNFLINRYEEDPFDKDSKAYKSQQMVRNMHKSTSKLMNKSSVSVYEFTKKMVDEMVEKKEENIKVTVNGSNEEESVNIINNNEIDVKVNSEIDIEKLIKNKDRVWLSQVIKISQN